MATTYPIASYAGAQRTYIYLVLPDSGCAEERTREFHCLYDLAVVIRAEVTHVVTIDDIQLTLFASAEQQMSWTTRLIGQQDGTTGTKIKVVVIEFLLVERSEPVHNVKSAAGWLQLQCGIAEVAASARDIEIAIRDEDINIAGAVGG